MNPVSPLSLPLASRFHSSPFMRLGALIDFAHHAVTHLGEAAHKGNLLTGLRSLGNLSYIPGIHSVLHHDQVAALKDFTAKPKTANQERVIEILESVITAGSLRLPAELPPSVVAAADRPTDAIASAPGIVYAHTMYVVSPLESLSLDILVPTAHVPEMRLAWEEGVRAEKVATPKPKEAPKTQLEGALRLVGFIRESKNQSLKDKKVHLLAAVLRAVKEELLDGNAIEAHIQNKTLIRSFYEAQAELEAAKLSEPYHDPASALSVLGKDDGPVRIGILASGQAAKTLMPETRDLYETYPYLRPVMEAEAARLKARSGGKIDVMDWIKNPSNALTDGEIVSHVEISGPLGAVAQAGYKEFLRYHGITADIIRAGAGHSQGIETVFAAAGGLTDEEAIADLEIMGEAYAASDPAVAGRTTSVSVGDIKPFKREAIVNAYGKPELTVEELVEKVIKKLGDKTQFISINPNTNVDHTLFGTPAALEELGKEIAAINKERDKAGLLPIKFLVLPVRHKFHTKQGMASGEAQLRQGLAAANIRVRQDGMAFPVYGSHDGLDFRNPAEVLDPTEKSVTDRSTQAWDFRKPLERMATEAKVNVVIDIGSSSIIGNMARKNFEGMGIRVISVATPEGRAELVNAKLEAVKLTSAYPENELVRTEDGSLQVDNAWTRKTGLPPIMVGGMTPTTVAPKTVATIVNAGFAGEIATGGHRIDKLEEAIWETDRLTEPGKDFGVNLILLNKEIWPRQLEVILKCKREGAKIGWVTLTAGTPDDPAAVTKKCEAAGIRLMAKIGPAKQVDKYLEAVKANPELKGKIALVLEGGEAGGHHADQVLAQMWEENYAKFFEEDDKGNKVPLVMIGAAGGIRNEQDAVDMMTHGPVKGGPDRPAHFVILGTRMMATREALTDDAGKLALVKARSADIVTHGSEMRAPQHMIKGDMTALIDDLMVACERCAETRDGKKSYRAFTRDEKIALAQKLEGSAKPWFGMIGGEFHEIHEMTYAQVIDRFVELSRFKDQWIDPYLGEALVKIIRHFERRLASQLEGSPTFLLKDGEKIEDVAATVAAFKAKYPSYQDRRIMLEDQHFLVDLFHTHRDSDLAPVHKQPVWFIYEMESNNLALVRYFKQALVRSSHSGGRNAASHTMLQAGKPAIDGITKVNEPMAEVLGSFHSAVVGSLQGERGAEQFPLVPELGAEPYRFVPLRGIEGIEARVSGNNLRLEVKDAAKLDKSAYRTLLLGGTSGVAAQVLGTATIYDESGKSHTNGFWNIFSPRTGQVIERELDDQGQLVSLSIFDGERVRVRIQTTSAGKGELSIYPKDPKGDVVPVTWKFSNQGRRLTADSSNAAAVAAAYQKILFPGQDSVQADATGYYRSSGVVADQRIDAYVQATGDNLPEYVQGDHTGRRVVPPHMAIAIADDVWLKCAFGLGINPLDLLHSKQKFQWARGVVLRAGDQFEAEARPVSAVNSSKGKTVGAEGRIFIVRDGERIEWARFDSDFFVKGDFSKSHDGFQHRDESFELKASKRFIRRTQEDYSRAITWKEGVVLDREEVLQVRVSVDSKELPNGKSHHVVSGKIFRKTGKEIGSIRAEDDRTEKQPLPVIGEPLMAHRRIDASKMTPVPNSFVPYKQEVVSRAPRSMGPYAAASGDHNPLHVDEYMARAAGFAEPLAHGMWTSEDTLKILTAGAFVDLDASRVRSFEIIFSLPVGLNEKLTTKPPKIIGVKDAIVYLAVEKVNEAGKTVLSGVLGVDQPETWYLYSGQGDQAVGMGEDLAQSSPAARAVMEEAEEVSREFGFSIKRVMWEKGFKEFRLGDTGEVVRHPDHVLNLTQFTQPAMAVSVEMRAAAMRETQAFIPHAAASGLSLGEYLALRALEVIDFKTSLRLTYRRGATMGHYVDPWRDPETGASAFMMSALSGIKTEQVQQWCQRVMDETGLLVEPSNFNTTNQTIVGGYKEAVEKVQELARAFMKAEAARKKADYKDPVAKVDVDVPFHTRLLALGIPEFRKIVDGVSFKDVDLTGRYVPNFVGKPFSVKDEFLEATLVRLKEYQASLQKPIFQNVLKDMKAHGIDADALLPQLSRLIEEDIRTVESYKSAADGASLPAAEKQTRLLRIMLCYQFAAPTRLAESIAEMIDPAKRIAWLAANDPSKPARPIARVVEFGMGSRVLGMVDSAARNVVGEAKIRAHVRGGLVQKAIVADWKELNYIKVEEAAAEEAATPVTASAQTAAAAAPVAVAPIVSVVAVPTDYAPPADAPLTAETVIVALTALKIGLRPEEISLTESLVALTKNDSNTYLPILQNAGKEFGGIQIEKGESIPIKDLASQAPAPKGLGEYLRDAFQELVTGKLPGLGTVASVEKYLADEWQLPKGLMEQVKVHFLLFSRAGVSIGDGKPLTAEEIALVNPLGDRKGVEGWIDAAVRQYGDKNGLKLVKKSDLKAAETAGGPKVDENAVVAKTLQGQINALRGILAGMGPEFQDGAVRKLMEMIADLEGKLTAVTAKAGQLDALRKEVGVALEAAVKPAFDPLKTRDFHGFADEGLVRHLFDVRSGRLTDVERTSQRDRIANASGQKELVLVRSYIRAVVEEGRPNTGSKLPFDRIRRLAVPLAKKDGKAWLKNWLNLEAAIHQQAGQPSHVLADFVRVTRPRSVPTAEGKVDVQSVARAGIRNVRQYVRHLVSGGYVGFEPTCETSPTVLARALNATAEKKLSFKGRVGLFTGASDESIAVASVKSYLQGGGHAIITTSGDINKVRNTEFGRMSTHDYYERLAHEFKGRGAKVTFLSYNQGSPSDARNALNWLLRVRQIWPDDILAFAANPVEKDMGSITHARDGKPGEGLATLQINGIGVDMILAEIASIYDVLGVKKKPTVVLAESPNLGTIGGDGEYGTSKAHLEVLQNLQRTEYGWKEWGSRFTLIGARMGLVITGLTGGVSEAAGALIDKHGAEVFYNDQMGGVLIPALLHPDVVAAAKVTRGEDGSFSRQGNFIVDYTGKLRQVKDVSVVLDRERKALNKEAGHLKESASEHAELAKALGTEKLPPEAIDPLVGPARRRPLVPEIIIKKSPGRVNIPDDTPVIFTMADVSAAGTEEQRWALESVEGDVKRMETLRLMELGIDMNLLDHDPRTGGYKDARTGDPVSPAAFRAAQAEYVQANIGNREVDSEMFRDFNGQPWDPRHENVVLEARLPHGVDWVYATEAEAKRNSSPAGWDSIRHTPDGWVVPRPEGGKIYVPGTAARSRFHAAYRPKGLDPVRLGMTQKDAQASTWSNVFAKLVYSRGLANAGYTPDEWYAAGHQLFTSFAMGTGMSSSEAQIDMVLNGIFDVPDGKRQPIIFGLPDQPGADIVMQHTAHGIGSKLVIIGACATFLLVLKAAQDLLRSGQARKVLAGAVDTPVGRAANREFTVEGVNATVPSLYLQGRGIPFAYGSSTSGTIYKDGFNLGEGAALVGIETWGQAKQDGDPVLAFLSEITNTSGGTKVGRTGPDWGAIAYDPFLMAGLQRFGYGIDEVDGYSPHWTGTMADVNEVKLARNQHEYWGRSHGRPLWWDPSKDLVGHLTGPSSGVALNRTIQSFRDRRILGRPFMPHLDPAIEQAAGGLILFNRRAIEDVPAQYNRVRRINSFGFGSNNAQADVVNPEGLEERAMDVREASEVYRKRDKRRYAIEDKEARRRTGGLPQIMYPTNNPTTNEDMVAFRRLVHKELRDRGVLLA